MNKTQLQKVRDALWLPENSTDEEFAQFSEAFAILDCELAKPEPEPVAWQERRAIYRKGGVKWSEWYLCDYTSKQVAAARESTPSDEYEWRPLFATPPSREWQELSPLEMQDTLRNCAASTFDKLAPNWYEVRQFARAIESALRAKNTGEQA